MNKHFDPKTDFTQGNLNEAGVRVFPSVDDLSQKFGVSRSSLFKKFQKENWHAEGLLFQKRLAIMVAPLKTGLRRFDIHNRRKAGQETD